jgi:cell division protein FtsB
MSNVSTVSLFGLGSILISFAVGYSTHYLFSENKNKKKQEEIEKLNQTVEELRKTVEILKTDLKKPEIKIKEEEYLEKIKLKIHDI